MTATIDNAIARPSADVSPPAVTKPPRLESLDVFRGMTVAGMIVVNDPGTWSAMYWPLAHADELMSENPSGWYPGKAWVDANGWTPTDLIFPFFLFIVGVSMVLSFAARQERGAARWELLKHAARRSAVILGFCLAAGLAAAAAAAWMAAGVGGRHRDSEFAPPMRWRMRPV